MFGVVCRLDSDELPDKVDQPGGWSITGLIVAMSCSLEAVV